jgi:hypothetical protein
MLYPIMFHFYHGTLEQNFCNNLNYLIIKKIVNIKKNETSKPELHTQPAAAGGRYTFMEHGTLQIAFCFLGFPKP